jgi:hypothetical protein
LLQEAGFTLRPHRGRLRILAAPADQNRKCGFESQWLTLERPMEPDVEAIAEFIRESRDADEAYITMLRFVIRAGEQVLGPERADATLSELLLDESAAQVEGLLQGSTKTGPRGGKIPSAARQQYPRWDDRQERDSAALGACWLEA